MSLSSNSFLKKQSWGLAPLAPTLWLGFPVPSAVASCVWDELFGRRHLQLLCASPLTSAPTVSSGVPGRRHVPVALLDRLARPKTLRSGRASRISVLSAFRSCWQGPTVGIHLASAQRAGSSLSSSPLHPLLLILMEMSLSRLMGIALRSEAGAW